MDSKKLLSDPVQYIPIARKAILQRFCGLFQNSGFFLQGQMDIHPLARWRSPVVAATGGFLVRDDSIRRQIMNLEPYDNVRRDMLTLLLRMITERQVPGEIAELGVYQGSTARLIHHYAPERPLHLFDTFAGFTDRGAREEESSTGTKISSTQFSDTSMEGVKQRISPQNNNVHFHPGFFPESLPAGFDPQFAFVHLDADLYEPIKAGLEFFYPRLSRQGVLVVHDYNGWVGSRKAVNEFFADKSEIPLPMPDKSGSAVIVKQ